MVGQYAQPPRFSYPNPLNASPTRPAPLRPPSIPVRVRPGVAPLSAPQPRRRPRTAKPQTDPLLLALTKVLLMTHPAAQMAPGPMPAPMMPGPQY